MVLGARSGVAGRDFPAPMNNIAVPISDLLARANTVEAINGSMLIESIRQQRDIQPSVRLLLFHVNNYNLLTK